MSDAGVESRSPRNPLHTDTDDHIQYVSNRLISPLRRIRGPFLASVTDYWLVLMDLAGLRTLTIHRLHLKYGPIVRIGPHEVSFADQDSVNEIYSQQTAFMKAEIYDTMSVKPLGIFSQRDKALHSQRRSLLSYAFSQGNVNTCAPLIHGHILKLLRRVQESAGKPIDILSLFRLFSLDVVGMQHLSRLWEVEVLTKFGRGAVSGFVFRRA